MICRKILFDWLAVRLEKYFGTSCGLNGSNEAGTMERSIAASPVVVTNLNSSILVSESR